MRNITVLHNRLDESNGTVENVLEMKTTAKKTPWFLRFAQKAKGIVSFVQNLLTRKEGVRGGQVSAFFQSAAAVVVGVGLFLGSLVLLAEPVQWGPGGSRTMNVCAPVVHYLEVTNDGSAGFRVSASLASDGWDMFRWVPPSVTGLSYWTSYGYKFVTFDAVLYNPLARGKFTAKGLSTRDGTYHRSVYFDYFVRGGSGGTRGFGGKYFSMRIKPAFYGLVPVRANHYYTEDHWVNITLYITDRDPHSKTNARLPNGGYNMHCWVSDTDGNGYLVTVYLDNDGDGTFEQAF